MSARKLTLFPYNDRIITATNYLTSWFMKLGGSILYSKELSNNHYPEPK